MRAGRQLRAYLLMRVLMLVGEVSLVSMGVGVGFLAVSVLMTVLNVLVAMTGMGV